MTVSRGSRKSKGSRGVEVGEGAEVARKKLHSHQRQSEARVAALSLDRIEGFPSVGRKGRDRRIVLHLLDRALVIERHLHPRIEYAVRIERSLHAREEVHRVSAPRSRGERCSKAAVAVLTCERSPKRRDERCNLVKQPFDLIAPIRDTHVDQWVHVNVRIPGVAKYHTPDFPGREG